MIDIHSHVLPKIDDGPQSWEESMAMIRLAQEDGIEEIAITHHILSNLAYEREEEIIIKFQELQKRIKAENLKIKIHLGSEIYAQPDMELFHTISTYNNNKKYFLVEFPMQGIPKFVADRFFDLVLDGMVPIIAHPERNMSIIKDPQLAFDFVQRGALLQTNAGSLVGRHGDRVRTTAFILMNSQLVHIVASDGHNVHRRPIKLSDAWQVVCQHWGEDRAHLLFRENPRKVLQGEDILPAEPQPVRPLEYSVSSPFGFIKRFFGKD
ncbi:MAG: hypothetical protein D6813_14870 [Calditrichaeota bacterium]|nr:MAG: hypothetical protein D6813_14870 [Calditrichota bacterium]